VKVLLLSAYAAQSHLQWQRNLQAMFTGWQWRVLTLPPRHFSWRVRGNPLYWALEQRQVLEDDHDLLLATSMVDLATLRGLVPGLGQLPAALYFHENQFAYPEYSQRPGLLEAQMVSLYGALAADALLFNSAYNRDSFLDGCSALLKRLPDYAPAGCVTVLREKSRVLPVPLGLSAIPAITAQWPGRPGVYPSRPLRLVWSARFEHDKGGERLYSALRALERVGLDYEVALTGQRFRRAPGVFDDIARDFGQRVVHMGYLDSREAYLSLLRGGDVVLSTALHEFQGLAVLEAVAAGCLPAVPDRQAYPEIYPARFCYRCHDDIETEARAAADLVAGLAAELERGRVAPPDVSGYNCDRLHAAYAGLFAELAG
jgi:glycosyltransferase involved in cell wall biosynthesis